MTQARLAVLAFAFCAAVAACGTGISHAQAVELALRNAPKSAVPVAIELVADGRLDRFIEGGPPQDRARHVWAVGLVGSFEGEGGMGRAPSYRHHLILLDHETGEVVAEQGSS